MKLYASLVGPLLGLYYPLPFEDETICRLALQTSRLANLWCAVYPEDEINDHITKWGGIKLDDSYSKRLDYDSSIVK